MGNDKPAGQDAPYRVGAGLSALQRPRRAPSGGTGTLRKIFGSGHSSRTLTLNVKPGEEVFTMNTWCQFTAMAILCTLTAAAQEVRQAEDAEATYTRAIHQRADKIVATLGLTNTDQAARVREVIAGQYRHLRDIDDARDAASKAAKKKSAGDKAATEAAVKPIQDDAKAKVDKLHQAFLGQLAKELTPDQVDKVKDGMTYGVMPLTYGVYLKMFPDLRDDQRAQIRSWLIEAREIAMDGGTSQEKHAVFGKYKGRINNYLSKAGYDLKRGEENLRK